MKKELINELVELRSDIQEAICSLNPVEMVTPVNYTEERAKWLSQAPRDFTNPVFVYNDEILEQALEKSGKIYMLDRKVLDAKKWLADSSERRSRQIQFQVKLLEHAIRDALGAIEIAYCILHEDDRGLKNAVIEKYGFPAKRITQEAWLRAKGNHLRQANCQADLAPRASQKLREVKLGAEEIAKYFTYAMEQYSTEDVWDVVIEPGVTSIDVRDKNASGRPEIVIPEDSNINGLKLVELVGHEIEAHWRDSLNSVKTVGAIKSDNELIYEGHAKLIDEMVNRHYGGFVRGPEPYYIVAIDMARAGMDFAKVSRALFDLVSYGEWVSEKDCAMRAWKVAYRVFRGLQVTSSNERGYAFTKDRAYYEGYQKAVQLKQSGRDVLLNFSILPPYLLDEMFEIGEHGLTENDLPFPDKKVRRDIVKILLNS